MPSFFSVLFRASAHHPLNRRPFLLAVLLFFFQSAACANELPWVEHSVLRGETADSIAAKYAVSSKTVERANELAARTEPLKTGEKLLVPKKETDLLSTLAEVRARRRGESPLSSITREQSKKVSLPAPRKSPLPRPAEPFIRPLAGRITSPYGMRGGRLHDGVDIPAPKGTPIVASRPGKVVFSGTIQGFGRTVTIDHGDGMKTRYSHNSANLVKKGDVVRQGQPIAKVGRTGRATCTHVHFSVLINGKAINPEKYLR